MAEAETGDLTTLTVQLLSAYFSSNSVPSDELAALIETTRTALAGKSADSEVIADTPVEYKPVVTVRKSTASPDHIISLIDGKPYKSLKRHLGTHGLTPATYRERYKLPKSYPMVAPTYAAERRAIAERVGLGRKKADVAAPANGPENLPANDAPSPVVVPAGEANEASTATTPKRAARSAKAAIAEVKPAPAPAAAKRAGRGKAVSAPAPVAQAKLKGRKAKTEPEALESTEGAAAKTEPKPKPTKRPTASKAAKSAPTAVAKPAKRGRKPAAASNEAPAEVKSES